WSADLAGMTLRWRPIPREEDCAMLQDGDKAPEIELPLDGGETLKLSRLKGKPVVVYFYPKDDTSGCTTEAKDFTRLAPEFRKAGVEVIGISPDGVEAHAKSARSTASPSSSRP